MIDGDDILGDGVNVAARLEGLAEPGGIGVSGTVMEHVAGKLDLGFEDMGEQRVNGVSRPTEGALYDRRQAIGSGGALRYDACLTDADRAAADARLAQDDAEWAT